jgi:hypothetical protein
VRSFALQSFRQARALFSLASSLSGVQIERSRYSVYPISSRGLSVLLAENGLQTCGRISTGTKRSRSAIDVVVQRRLVSSEFQRSSVDKFFV